MVLNTMLHCFKSLDKKKEKEKKRGIFLLPLFFSFSPFFFLFNNTDRLAILAQFGLAVFIKLI